MNIYAAIKKRHSIRKYKPDPVPEDKLNRIMEAVRLAPSGKNGQPWRFILVRDASTKTALVPACKGQGFIAQADLVIVACANEGESYQNQGGYMKSWPLDIAIALDHLMLAAAAEGLGACWIGAFIEPGIKKILSIPDDLRVVGLTPLGWPDEDPKPKPRKPLNEIMFFEHL